jgi:hypothetical protein
MNGLGHSAWARARQLKPQQLRVDDKKQGKLITEMAKAHKSQISGDLWDFARILFREAQIQGLVPAPMNQQFGTLVPDTEEGWRSLSHQVTIDDDDFELVWEIARDALIEDIKLAYQGIISYDDQIYCSVLLGGVFSQYPIVFVDEDQDLSPLQIRMIKRSLGRDSRILAVGDKCQSIYAFRGAVGEAAEQIRELRDSWIDLPLMTSFRVPKLVADRQRDHVPAFRAFGGNPDGRIHTMTNDIDGWHWEGLTNVLPEWPSEVAILCRNNAPLLSMAFKLIRQGIGCHVLGRDISKGLKALTKKICPDDATVADTVRGRVTEWLNMQLSKASDDDAEISEKYNDKAESILAILESSEAKDAGQLRRQIDRLFDRDSGVVTLSTIHKAKGLEWPSVIHLDPFRVPSFRAVKQGGRALEQEKNLKYVCETRTKHTLINANLEGFQ